MNEVEEEPDNELTLDEYMKQQTEKKSKLLSLTGGSAAKASAAGEFKGMSKVSKVDADSDWSAFETGGKTKSSKTKKEKQVLQAGFRIKDDNYVPRGGRGGGRGGGGGGRGGARGGRGGRGGMNARLDDANDFPSL